MANKTLVTRGKNMSKSILVIDTPDCCRECPLCAEDRQTYRDYCRITDDVIWTLNKPDWCPLKQIPKKIDFNGAFEAGYNYCINDILGGKTS